MAREDILKSYEWNAEQNRFLEIEDPTWNPELSDVAESISRSGYFREFSSQEDDSLGASIDVYRTDIPGRPCYYINIMGENTGIASLVARDFPSLATTLQQIQPFLTLIRLDQVVWCRSRDRETTQN